MIVDRERKSHNILNRMMLSCTRMSVSLCHTVSLCLSRSLSLRRASFTLPQSLLVWIFLNLSVSLSVSLCISLSLGLSSFSLFLCLSLYLCPTLNALLYVCMTCVFALYVSLSLCVISNTGPVTDIRFSLFLCVCVYTVYRIYILYVCVYAREL